VIAWTAIKYSQFLSLVSEGLTSPPGASSVTVVLIVLGCLAAFPILTMIRLAERDSRWRLLPINRRERIVRSVFRYFFQLGFVLLTCTVAMTAWICKRELNPEMWPAWVVLATVFWGPALSASFIDALTFRQAIHRYKLYTKAKLFLPLFPRPQRYFLQEARDHEIRGTR
jgi:hypothetical protein